MLFFSNTVSITEMQNILRQFASESDEERENPGIQTETPMPDV